MSCYDFAKKGDRAGFISCLQAGTTYITKCNTPRRKNWYLFKAEVRAFGGYGYTKEQWQQMLSVKTSDPKTNPWDVYRSLYEGKYVPESKGFLGGIGSAIGSGLGAVTQVAGFAIGGPIGGAIGKGIGSTIGSAMGGSPGTFKPVSGPLPSIEPEPIKAGCAMMVIYGDDYGGNIPEIFYEIRDKLPGWSVKYYYYISPMIVPYITMFHLERPLRFLLNKCIR